MVACCPDFVRWRALIYVWALELFEPSESGFHSLDDIFNGGSNARSLQKLCVGVQQR